METTETVADIMREQTPTDRFGNIRKPTVSNFVALRDHFAGQALAECIRIADDVTPGKSPKLSDLFAKAAVFAYFAADAMLVAREVSKEGE